MFISIMKKLSSFDRYLSEGYDNICDYPTYKYYLKLRRRNLIRKFIKNVWKRI